MIDEVLQTPLELLALGDVLHLRDEVQRPALVVADERDAQQHPDRVAPGVPEPLLDLIRRDAPVEQLQILRRVDVGIVRIRQVAKRAGADSLGRIPGDPAQRVIHPQQPAGHVHECHADRRVRERVLESATHRSVPSGAPVHGGAGSERGTRRTTKMFKTRQSDPTNGSVVGQRPTSEATAITSSVGFTGLAICI